MIAIAYKIWTIAMIAISYKIWTIAMIAISYKIWTIAMIAIAYKIWTIAMNLLAKFKCIVIINNTQSHVLHDKWNDSNVLEISNKKCVSNNFKKIPNKFQIISNKNGKNDRNWKNGENSAQKKQQKYTIR